MNIIELHSSRAWLTIPYFENHLYDELNAIVTNEASFVALQSKLKTYGHFLCLENLPPSILRKNIFWKQLELTNPFLAEFSSIKEAANLLKSIQRNWMHCPFTCIRRGELIQDSLPFINRKPKQFYCSIPTSPIGVFTLLDSNHLFASAITSSPFPLGEACFVEDKLSPPSRAYLKLYEALTLMDYYKRCACGDKSGLFGQRSEDIDGAIKPFLSLHCVDAGASPGGWTWVLDMLGANITAIDRTALAPNLMRKKNITFIAHDAFTIPLESFGKVDWVLSDVACYPPRLLEWVQKWLERDLCRNFVCTLKMQGKPDVSTIEAFASIPHSRLIHLFHNKHELTWLRSDFL